MMKLALLVCLAVSSSVYAESKKNDMGITKEEHMAAEAACKAIKADMRGSELKECIKAKLGIK